MFYDYCDCALATFSNDMNILFMLLTELEGNKKQAEQDRKAIDELIRERDILNKVSLLEP